jgi:TP901 family phage tail tape measure protein
MPFNAGSLVATLELNTKGWTEKIQAVQKDKQALLTSAANIGKGFQDMGLKMTAAGGALVLGLGAMIKKTANAGDAFWDLSQKTGISVETLSSFKLAADTSGTSIDGFAVGMRGLSRAVGDAKTGTGDAKKAFDALGVSFVDADGKARPLDQLFLDLAGKFSGMEDGATKTDLAMKLFGRSGVELIPMLNLGKQGLKDLTDRAKELGITFNTEAAKKCDEFNDSLDILRASVGASFRGIALELIPTLQDLATKVASAIGKVIEWTNAHPALTEAIGKLALGLAGIGTILAVSGPVLMGIGALMTNIGAIKLLALKSIVFTFALAGTAIVAMGVVKMIDDFKRLRLEGETTAEALRTMFLNFNPFKSLSRDKISETVLAMDEARSSSINLTGAVSLLDIAFNAIKGAIEDGAVKPAKTLASTVTDVLIPAVDNAKLALASMVQTIALEVTPKTAGLEALIKDFTPALQGVDWQALPEGAKPALDQVGIAVETMRERIADNFAGLFLDIKSGFVDTFTRSVDEGWGFSRFMDEIFKTIRTSLIRTIGEMLADWMFGFIDKIKASATSAGKTIAESIGGATGGIGKAAGSMAGSFLSAAGSIASIVTAVASVVSLLKSPPTGAGDGMGRVVERQDQQTSLLTRIFEDINGNLKPTLWSISSKSDTQIKRLDTANAWLKSMDAALKGMKGAASGAVSTQTEMMVVHGTRSDPEYIMRASQLNAGIMPKATSGGGRQAPVVVNIKPVVIEKRDRYIIEFVQDSLNHGTLRIPASAVGG